MSAGKRESTRRDYYDRMLRVLDHIHHHLDEELTLEALAREACFSPYHFLYRELPDHDQNSLVADPLTEVYVRLQAES